MSEPVHTEVPPSEPATAMPNPAHPPNVFVTFPIVFINNPPSASPPAASQPPATPTDGNNTNPDEARQPQTNGSATPQINSEQYWVNLMLQTAEGLPIMLQRLGPFMSQGPFPGPLEPVPSGPPKKHATQSAIDKLATVAVTSLPEEERRCTICMQDYYIKPVGPRSPYVEDVRDEEDFNGQDVTSKIPNISLIAQEEETFQEFASSKDEGETPLRMPCGHVFGGTCLKEWLYQSPTCPLCRVEVESYTEEPQMPGFPSFPQFMFEAQTPRAVSRQEQRNSSNEMQIDPPATNASVDEAAPGEPETTPASNPTPTPTQPQFHPLAFQIIFTSLPSNASAADPPAATTPIPPPATPSVSRSSTPSSRPSTSHSVRHHPYARSFTPSPLSSPSIADRPDLFCAQRLSGLCPHDHNDESHLRLECGHAFHQDCLESSMAIEGYAINSDERRCPRCRRWTHIMQ